MSSANTPCSTCVQPLRAARCTASAECACTTERSPCAVDSPQAAASCASDIVASPPSRMDFDAKILITSAPAALKRRTTARSESGLPPAERSFMEPSDVSTRGPGMVPRLMASRSVPLSSSPMLCTVVKPACSVAHALPAWLYACVAGESPSDSVCSRFFAFTYQPMCTCVSMSPGNTVRVPRSIPFAGSAPLDGRTAVMRPSLTVMSVLVSSLPVPSMTRAARSTTVPRVCAAATCGGSVSSNASETARARRRAGTDDMSMLRGARESPAGIVVRNWWCGTGGAEQVV